MLSVRRTIIMLSAKRCGSTALFKVFQKHPEVGVCHVDQDIPNWEPNFWNLAARAIAGDSQAFVERFRQSHPFLKMPQTFCERSVFQLWETLLQEQGPILFDKSPQYLGNQEAIELLYKYKQQHNDVRIFALIRDPRDSITSQYTLWNRYVENDSPEGREQKWLKKYRQLKKLQQHWGYLPVFRYEDLSEAPACYMPMIFQFCGIRHIADTYKHIKPLHIGRYSTCRDKAIRNWKTTQEFEEHLKKYGYAIPQMDPIQAKLKRMRIFLSQVRQK